MAADPRAREDNSGPFLPGISNNPYHPSFESKLKLGSHLSHMSFWPSYPNTNILFPSLPLPSFHDSSARACASTNITTSSSGALANLDQTNPPIERVIDGNGSAPDIHFSFNRVRPLPLRPDESYERTLRQKFGLGGARNVDHPSPRRAFEPWMSIGTGGDILGDKIRALKEHRIIVEDARRDLGVMDLMDNERWGTNVDFFMLRKFQERLREHEEDAEANIVRLDSVRLRKQKDMEELEELHEVDTFKSTLEGLQGWRIRQRGSASLLSASRKPFLVSLTFAN